MRVASLQQGPVVGYEENRGAVTQQKLFQPADRVHVEVVGRLVEQQNVGAANQGPGQEHAAFHAGREIGHLASARATCGRESPRPLGSSTSRPRSPGRAGCGRAGPAVRRCRPAPVGAPRGDTRPAVRPGAPSPRATSSKTVPESPCGTSCGSMAVTSPCCRAISPRGGSISPWISRSSVLLPVPFRPSRQTRSPGSSVRLA